MKIKNIIFGTLAATVALSLAGCYEKFDLPEPPVRYDDTYFTDRGYTVKNIKEIKDLFADPAHDLTNLDGNTAKGGNPQNSPLYTMYYPIEDMFVTKGKVITNDAYGNFYNSLFIQDETGGIEVKVGDRGMYTKYPPGTTIYVLCDGLVLGNYRSMLSLGLAPDGDDSVNPYEDRSDNLTPYPNRFISVPELIDRFIKLGDEEVSLTDADVTEIEVGEAINDAQLYKLCGKLVRLKGLQSVWDGPTVADGYPNFLYKYALNTYESFSFQQVIKKWQDFDAAGRPAGQEPMGIQSPTFHMPEPQNNYLPGAAKGQPTWGFQEYEHNGYEWNLKQHNFGSAKFTKTGYSGSAEILIRTSGYARFALEPVTPNGKHIDVTGVISRYTSGSGGYPAFQITVNNITDIVQID